MNPASVLAAGLLRLGRRGEMVGDVVDVMGGGEQGVRELVAVLAEAIETDENPSPWVRHVADTLRHVERMMQPMPTPEQFEEGRKRGLTNTQVFAALRNAGEL